MERINNSNYNLDNWNWDQLLNIADFKSFDLELLNKGFIINIIKSIENSDNSDALVNEISTILFEKIFSNINFLNDIRSIENSENRTNLILLIQFYWYINNPEKNISIDWLYWPQTHSIAKEFLDIHSLQNNLKNNNNSLSNILFSDILEWLDNADNLNMFFSMSFEVLLRNYLDNLNSSNWISLNPEDIYKDIFNSFTDIKKYLPLDNIYRNNIDIIINNFLLPEKDWKFIINNTINKLLSLNNDELLFDENDVSMISIIFKWAVWSIIDFSRIDNEDLDVYIDELKSLDIISNLLEDFPDFDNIINLIVESSRLLDKDKTLMLIDNFFDYNLNNLLIIGNLSDKGELDENVKLDLINSAWNLITDLTDENTINLAINQISNFESIKWNELINHALDIINDSRLSDNDRYRLFLSLSTLVDTATKPWITDDNEFEDDVRQNLNDIILILWEFNWDWKLDEKKLLDFIKKIIWDDLWDWEKLSFFDKVSRINSISEFWSLIYDNTDTLFNFIRWKVNWEWWLDYAIKEFITNKRLIDNIEKSWWNLMWRIWDALKLNTTNAIISIREAVLEADISFWHNRADNLNLSNIEVSINNLSDLIVDSLLNDFKKFFLNKLENGDSITRKDLTEFVISNFANTINNNDSKNILLNNLSDIGFDFNDNIEHLSEFYLYLSNNEAFINLVDYRFSHILNNITSWNSIILSINWFRDWIDVFLEDFFNTKENQWLFWSAELFFRKFDNNDIKLFSNLVSDIIYDYWSNPSKLSDLINSFWLNDYFPDWLEVSEFSNIFQSIIDQIPKDIIHELIISESRNVWKLNDIDYVINIVWNLLKDPRINLNNIVSLSISNSNINSLLSNVNSNSNDVSINLDYEKVNMWVDLIYKLFNESNNNWKTAILNEMWLLHFNWFIDLLLVNISPNDLKLTLNTNLDLLNSLINWKALVWDQLLKFIDDIYHRYPSSWRIELINKILDSWLLNNKTNHSSSFEINPINSWYFSNILFNTIWNWNNSEILNIINKLNPEIWEYLSYNLLWNTNFENTILILNAIWQNWFNNFLIDNYQTINSLNSTSIDNDDYKLKITELANNMFLSIKMEWFWRNFDKENLSKNENFILKSLPYIQDWFSLYKDDIPKLVLIWSKIQEYISSGDNDITKYWLSSEDIDFFSSTWFDLINNIISSKMSWEWINRRELASLFDIPSWWSSSEIDYQIWSFIWNNIWFSLFWWIASIFKWREYAMRNWTIDYFSDWSKKDSFVKHVKTILL